MTSNGSGSARIVTAARSWGHGGRIVTFGQELDRTGRYACWKRWRFKRRSGTGSEWDSAVRWFFETRIEHGLRHAYWEAHGAGAVDTTHVTHGRPRWFDHLFVSEHFAVESCDYEHGLRRRGLSDHSAVWARLKRAGAC
jgi:hypothetical protein